MTRSKNKQEEPVNLEGPPRHYLYVVECADGTWYTGYTTDIDERIKAHNAGLGAKYTRSRGPVRLVASALFATKHSAMSAEYHFKRLSRKQKESLIQRARSEPFVEVLSEAFFVEKDEL